jgi:Isochorismatase family
LDIPLVITEHVSKVLGKTFPELIESYPSKNVKIFEKTKFSMLTDEVLAYLQETKKTNVVLYGIEAHVCI